MLVGSISPPYSTCVHRTSSPPAELATPGTNGKYIFIHYFFKIEGFFILTCAGSSVWVRAAPVVQAVAVSAGGVSYAGVLGGAG